MSVRWRIGTLLALAGLIGLSACSDPDEATGIVRPKASPSAGASPGGLTGGVDGPTTTEPLVQYVRLDVATLSLNVPPAAGLVSAGLPSTASLNPRALLTDGQLDPVGVDWQIQDPSRLTVDAAGVVSLRADAAVGVTTVTAVSKRNPTLKAQAAITITRDGILEVKGLEPGGSGYVRANVTRNGTYVANQVIDEPPRIRLPGGVSYDVQLQRVSGNETTVVKNFADLLIPPNAVAIATVSP